MRISSSSGSGLAPASQTFPYASSIRTHSASRRPSPTASDRATHSSLATPPTGDSARGTGMNTAIADGFNLGWKLSWVLKGWAPDSLLVRTRRNAVRPRSTMSPGLSTLAGAAEMSPTSCGSTSAGGFHLWIGGRWSHLEPRSPRSGTHPAEARNAGVAV